MRARLMKVGAALAALGALAAGGSTLASAGSKQAPPAPPAAVEKQGADTDTLQQGDQSAPDTAAEAAGSESESASESGVSDGPGGYADSAANADTQQQGET
ncbi:MAG: hypothetical protein QOF50_716 [Gaiellaceae bacterium]|nr:hypothetical protein [Gaiellaceae bacterium]